MTGKEALENIRVNTRYRYVTWNRKHIEVIEQELNELAKYKRAFEIFRGREVNVYPKFDGNTQYVITLNKEEYELLEELMKGA